MFANFVRELDYRWCGGWWLVVMCGSVTGCVVGGIELDSGLATMTCLEHSHHMDISVLQI